MSCIYCLKGIRWISSSSSVEAKRLRSLLQRLSFGVGALPTFFLVYGQLTAWHRGLIFLFRVQGLGFSPLVTELKTLFSFQSRANDAVFGSELSGPVHYGLNWLCDRASTNFAGLAANEGAFELVRPDAKSKSDCSRRSGP